MVSVMREEKLKEKTLSAMQLSKGVKRQEPTFLTTLKEEETVDDEGKTPMESPWRVSGCDVCRTF